MEHITLPFVRAPDLTATMDIQIPALAWSPCDSGAWTRMYRINGVARQVIVTADGSGEQGLQFSLAEAAARGESAARGPGIAAMDTLASALREHFPRQIATLSLDGHPALQEIYRVYGGVIIMHADPFEALVLTILSQNRTGEIVRKVYPALDSYCGGLTADRLAAVPEDELAQVIRSAGPYKSGRLIEAARRVAEHGDAFTKLITEGPPDEALTYLMDLPGVGHKTAACVLVFAADSDYTLPVDTHLFRVADRLGLVSHGGRLNSATRDRVIASLLSHSPDLALAHFVFLLLGRTTCVAGTPRCGECFMRRTCRVGSLASVNTAPGSAST